MLFLDVRATQGYLLSQLRDSAGAAQNNPGVGMTWFRGVDPQKLEGPGTADPTSAAPTGPRGSRDREGTTPQGDPAASLFPPASVREFGERRALELWLR